MQISLIFSRTLPDPPGELIARRVKIGLFLLQVTLKID